MEQEKNNGQGINKSLASIEEAIGCLSQKMDNQNQRIDTLEKVVLRQEKPIIAEKIEVAPEYPKMAPTMSPASSQINVASPSPIADIPREAKANLEENIGVKWFARVGITALILGVSFFLKYAFDNNWIGEVGRVTIGVISGLILLGLGEKYIRKYSVYGQIMSGGGIAVLYLSIFAAFDFYRLLDQIPAFLFMILVTAIGIILSVRYDALSLVVVATIGGFATPFLISTGKNNEVGLFSYILLLDLAILATSMFKKWRELSIIGFAGTIITFIAWSFNFYRKDELMITMLFLTLFFIVFSISSLIYNLVKKEKSSGVEQLLTIGSASAFFGASYALLNPDYHPFMGFFALIVGIYYFLWAYLVKMVTAEDKNLYNFLAFLTVGFITLAIPIQFEKNMITISWIIEAVLLLALGIKIKENTLKIFGIIIFAFVFSRLMSSGLNYPENSMIILNEVAMTFAIAILAAYFSAYLFRKWDVLDEQNKSVNPVQMAAVFIILANFLTIFIGSREIANYYDQKIDLVEKRESQEYTKINQLDSYGSYNNGFYPAGNSYYEERDKLENKSSVLLSIFWLIYGIILLGIGIISKDKKLRIFGMLLFILAILKLFFYDLWSLGTLYRIISSISLGVVLLSISFAYQKYKDRLKEII